MQLVAVDLHQDNLVVAKMDPSDAAVLGPPRRYRLDRSSLGEFIASLGGDDVVLVESTTNAFWLAHRLESVVRSVHVLDTNAVHLRGNKTDALDAKKLLQMLSTFVMTDTLDQLPTVYVPTEGVMKLRALFSTYRFLKKQSTQLRNRMHCIYRQNGMVVARNDLQQVKRRARVLDEFPLEDYWREQIELLLDQYEHLLPNIQRTQQAILTLSDELFAEEIALLTTIPGFSPFTAAAFMSDVADIDRFKSAKKLCAYLKTAPSIRASSSTRHLGPVPKAGRSLTTTLLTQSILHLKSACPAYAAFWERLRAGKSPGKCRIALIRKTIATAYYMLKRKVAFSHANPTAYERKHRVAAQLVRGYQPPAKLAIQSSA